MKLFICLIVNLCFVSGILGNKTIPKGVIKENNSPPLADIRNGILNDNHKGYTQYGTTQYRTGQYRSAQYGTKPYAHYQSRPTRYNTGSHIMQTTMTRQPTYLYTSQPGQTIYYRSQTTYVNNEQPVQTSQSIAQSEPTYVYVDCSDIYQKVPSVSNVDTKILGGTSSAFHSTKNMDNKGGSRFKRHVYGTRYSSGYRTSGYRAAGYRNYGYSRGYSTAYSGGYSRGYVYQPMYVETPVYYQTQTVQAEPVRYVYVQSESNTRYLCLPPQVNNEASTNVPTLTVPPGPKGGDITTEMKNIDLSGIDFSDLDLGGSLGGSSGLDLEGGGGWGIDVDGSGWDIDVDGGGLDVGGGRSWDINGGGLDVGGGRSWDINGGGLDVNGDGRSWGLDVDGDGKWDINGPGGSLDIDRGNRGGGIHF